MGVTRAQKVRIKERRKQVATLYVEGWSLRQLAEKYGVAISSIHRDMEVVRQWWREDAVAAVDDHINAELELIRATIGQAWKGWYMSLDEKQRERTKLVESVKAGDSKAIERATEQQVGNPAYLGTLIKCSERRCKLLGLDEAEKIKVDVSATITVQEVAEEVRNDRDLFAILNARGGDGFPGVVRTGCERGALGSNGSSGSGEPGGNGNGNGAH